MFDLSLRRNFLLYLFFDSVVQSLQDEIIIHGIDAFCL